MFSVINLIYFSYANCYISRGTDNSTPILQFQHLKRNMHLVTNYYASLNRYIYIFFFCVGLTPYGNESVNIMKSAYGSVGHTDSGGSTWAELTQRTDNYHTTRHCFTQSKITILFPVIDVQSNDDNLHRTDVSRSHKPDCCSLVPCKGPVALWSFRYVPLKELKREMIRTTIFKFLYSLSV